MAQGTAQIGAPARRQSSDWVVAVVIVVVVVVILGIIGALFLVNLNLVDTKTGTLSVTVVNHDSDSRDVSIYIDGKRSTDELIPGGYQWTGLLEIHWTGTDPMKEVSLVSASGTQTKQVQMIETSVVSVSFDLY